MKTCTTMIQANGTTGEAWYGVYRGKMRGKSFDLNAAERIATYKLGRGEQADYRAMTAKHATPQAPAVRWQA